MSGDPSGRRAAWKGQAAGPPPRGPKYAWKPSDGAAPRAPRRLRQVLIGLGAIACLGLIIVLIKLLGWTDRAGLVLVGIDPAATMGRLDVPQDVYGWLGGGQLAQSAVKMADQEKSRWGKLTPEVFGENPLTPKSLSAQEFQAWVGQLADSRRNPLVVSFGLPGAASGPGPDGPFLFTANGRLKLKDVIDAFAGDRFRGRQVVLLFDPARFTADPALGVLHNDFVRGLQAMDQAIRNAASRLVVICGSSPGERAWDSEEWRCGAFTFAVLEGLRGGAAPPSQTAISAWDLFDFAKRTTEKWTTANRPTGQTPILLPDPAAGGRERAQAITVAVKTSEYTPADPDEAPGAKFTAPKELLARWQEHQRLDQAVPSPAVYSPRLWRRYRELLLRYEQLVRAGESTTAAQMAKALQSLEGELEDLRGLRRAFGSAPYALPLTAALGLDDAKAWADAQQTSDDLWSVRTRKAPEREKHWQDVKQKAGTALDGLRLRLSATLLRQRAGDARGPAEDVDDAAELLQTVYDSDPDAPRPAEVHFLLMLRAFDWAGQKPPPELRKRAVDVRQRAERAALAARPADADRPTHLYSEQVWPLVLDAVTAGDAERRPGEDLLFDDDDGSWRKSGELLDRAAAKYDEALKAARRLQDALALRDQALADLPFLTRWLAAQRLDEKALREHEDLWDKVHALDARLDELARQPDPAKAAALNNADLAAATAEVRAPFDDLVLRFQNLSSLSNFAILQENWQKIEQALAVPLIEPALRGKLVERSRVMSARFNDVRSGLQEEARVAVNDPARDRAVRQGRLARAVLGPAIPDLQAGLGLLKADGLQILFDAASGVWEDTYNNAGEKIGRHWEALAKLAKTTEDAVTTERRSRWTLAFAAPTEAEPAVLNRQRRWQRLLVDLARRTCLDHWYAENGQPYYRPAADRFLKDADGLVEAPAGEPKPALPGADAVTALLKLPRLTFDTPEMVDWTSELSRTLEFKVKAPPELKGNGFVTLWPQALPAPLILRTDDRGRTAREVAAAERSLRLDAPSSATKTDVDVVLTGYYRGQALEGKTKVRLDRTPVRVVTTITPPDDAGIAVRADRNFRGAVALVLDYSGSMNDPMGSTPKLTQAQAVLRQVLAELPMETHLSIRVYGHLPTPVPNVNDDDERFRQYTRATQSQRVFDADVTWGPNNLTPLDELMKKLKGFKAQGGTPLVRSMRDAKADFPEKYRGPRTLLVLTDGADTWYGNSTPTGRAMNPDVIGRVRKEFEDAFAEEKNLSIQMVVFTGSETEWKVAQQQFEAVTKFEQPGSLERASSATSLADKLVVALRPKLRLLDVTGGVVKGMPRTGLPADRDGARLENLHPSGPFAPGLYQGLVYNSLQRMSFERGDRLLIRLRSTGDDVRFERDLFANELQFRNAPRKEEGDWVLCVPQVLDEITPQSRQLRLMATLETTKDRKVDPEGILKQTTPRAVWWEVNPLPDGAGPQRVTNLFGYPAPAWDVSVDKWPAPPVSPPRLRVWCNAAPPDVAKRLTFTPGRGAPQKTEVDDSKPVEVSVAWEDYRLKTDPSMVEPHPIPCLVVRVKHATDHPILIQPSDLKPAAQEHRYYGSVNYTAVFGPLAPEKLTGGVVQLELVSVTKLKGTATPIELDLPAPALGHQRILPLRLTPVEIDGR